MATVEPAESRGPLDGTRVLDVAEPLGAYVGRTLGDLGADVIKIEPPAGDPGRHVAPFLTAGQERVSLPFIHANLNKRSVVLDLSQQHDQQRLGHDAWVALSCSTDAQWRALAQLIGEATRAHDPQYATMATRWQQHDTLDALISAWTRQCTRHQAVRLLQDAGVPAGVVQTGEDLWRDMHLRARGAIVTLEHAEPGTVEHTGLTVRLHGTPGQIQRPLGRMGEANEEVFGGLLGLSHEDLARFVEAGVLA